MSDGTNIVYCYDGSYDGFLCCVFESYSARELPEAIRTEDEAQETLFGVKYIETDMSRAKRVRASIPIKLSKEAAELMKKAFLCNIPNKELKMLDFLRLGYKLGGRVCKMEADDRVDVILKAVKFLQNEAHYSLEFLRFSQYGQFLGAEISPKNRVLPLMSRHFCDRLPDENFVIYDKSHKMAFFHQGDGKHGFLYDLVIDFPDPDAQEENYRRLWRRFYNTIAVEGRINHKLRRGNMPIRYWPNMTEFQEDVAPGAARRWPELPE